MCSLKMLAMIFVLALFPTAPKSGEFQVDLELALLVDRSNSMRPKEQLLQREGYVRAIGSPEIVELICAGPLGRIALTYIEFSDSEDTYTAIPWTLIDGVASARRFAVSLAEYPLTSGGGTIISHGLLFAADSFDGNGFDGLRRTIDVSGDGPNSGGVPVVEARDDVVARGIRINGLPILLDPDTAGIIRFKDLDSYYRDCVIGGAGAFVIPVTRPEHIGDAIHRKMAMEIAGGESIEQEDGRDILLPVLGELPTDCTIGEKQIEKFYDNEGD